MVRFLHFTFLFLILRAVNGNSNIELLIKKKAGSRQPFLGHKVIRAFPITQTDIDIINSLEFNPDIEIDFWARMINTDIHVAPEDYVKLDSLLKTHNIKYIILNNNLQASLDEEQKAHYRHSTSWHGDYHCFDEIVQKMNNLAGTYNNRAKLLNIGKTHEKQDILGLEISGPQNIPYKQKIVVMCGLHAREWISPATCMYIMEKTLRNYNKDAKIAEMVGRFNWVIFPVLNPDGYVYTWKSNRLWRKNRQPNEHSSCAGTDLNRNWSYEWGGHGTSKNPCSDVYLGTSAFSAQETKAISEYMKANRKNIFAFIDIHSYSQLWMYPWSFSKDKVTPDTDELSRVSDLAIEALKAVNGTIFEAGPGGKIIYEAAGSSKDWAYGEMKIKYSFALELRDEGQHGFVLPKEQIIPAAEETLASLQRLGASMNDYGDKTTSYYSQNRAAGTETNQTENRK